MSVEMITDVWKFAPYRGARLLVLLALADWSDDDGYCFPSYRSIAEKARITREAAITILRFLETEKAIRVELKGGGRSLKNEYQLLPENWKKGNPQLEKGNPRPEKGNPERHIGDAKRVIPNRKRVIPDRVSQMKKGNPRPFPNKEEPSCSIHEPSEEPSCQKSLADATTAENETDAGMQPEPTSPPPPPRPRAAAASRKTSIPDDFALTDDMRNWAMEHTPQVDSRLETEKFIDHAKANGRKQVDWLLSWRNWMRQAIVYQQRGRSGKQPARAQNCGGVGYINGDPDMWYPIPAAMRKDN